MLEVLDGFLVSLSGLSRGERSQITALAGLRILLTRIQAVLTALELTDHAFVFFGQGRYNIRRGRLLVRLAFNAALRRSADPRFRAADRAWRDSAVREAADRPSFFNDRFLARERVEDGLRRE